MNPEILLVDDDPAVIQFMARLLSGLGTQRFATDGESALRIARERTPDLVLLDAEMPGMSGFQVCQAMKEDAALRDVPVIFVTGHAEPEFEITGFGLGAADFISKPVQEPLLLARVRSQLSVKQQLDALRLQSTVDGLTALPNRRAFELALESEWRRAGRAAQPLAVLRVDIDYFPLFNERYGPTAGEQCLRLVARALQAAALRPGDVVARLGREQFCVLLPQTARAGAEHVAHRILDAVEALDIPNELSVVARHVTVSVGVSSHDEQSAGWIDASDSSTFVPAAETLHIGADLLEAAAKALRAAKQAGRAQAWRLDIGDVESPAQAVEVDPAHRSEFGRRRSRHH